MNNATNSFPFNGNTIYKSTDEFKGIMCCLPVKFNGRNGKAAKKFKTATLVKIYISFEKMRENAVYFTFYDENNSFLTSGMVFDNKLYYGIRKEVNTVKLLSLLYKSHLDFPIDILYEDILSSIPELIEFETRIGVKFKDKKILLIALLHHTFTEENRNFINRLNLRDQDNQKLEIIGDSALGDVILRHAYDNHLSFNEGDLTKLKSFLVKNNSIAKTADNLKLDKWLLKGNGESKNKIGKEKRLADTFEAIIGAINLDQGFETTKKFVLKHCIDEFTDFYSSESEILKEHIENQDSTSIFNQKYQQLYRNSPEFDIKDISDESPYFSAEIDIGDQHIIGYGTNSKLARKDASRKGLEFLT